MSEAWASGSDSRWRRFRTRVLERDHYRCTLQLESCTGDAEDVHHIQPLSRGGAKYDMRNCAAACGTCNRQVGNRVPTEQPRPRPTSKW